MPRAISSSPASEDSAMIGSPAKRWSARICRVRAEPVQARHLHVGGHQVDLAGVLVQQFPGCLAVFGRQHPAADGFHQTLNLPAEEVRIVGHQNGGRVVRHSPIRRAGQCPSGLLPRPHCIGQFENVQQAEWCGP